MTTVKPMTGWGVVARLFGGIAVGLLAGWAFGRGRWWTAFVLVFLVAVMAYCIHTLRWLKRERVELREQMRWLDEHVRADGGNE